MASNPTPTPTKQAAPAPIAKVFPDEINFKSACDIVGVQPNYFRKLLREGKLDDPKVVQKNVQGFWKFSKAGLTEWAANRPKNSRQGDGRTTYRIRLNDEEYELVSAALKGTSIELKLAYNRKAKKAAAEAAAKAPTK
jgi:hypothetical protein